MFDIAWQTVSESLNQLDESLIVRKPKIDRMFQDNEFRGYLLDLFEWAGLRHWLDYQGAWSLALFPATNGGRYFTKYRSARSRIQHTSQKEQIKHSYDFAR